MGSRLFQKRSTTPSGIGGDARQDLSDSKLYDLQEGNTCCMPKTARTIIRREFIKSKQSKRSLFLFLVISFLPRIRCFSRRGGNLF